MGKIDKISENIQGLVAFRIDARFLGIALIATADQIRIGIWGGFGMSGTGRELGPHGLADMTEVKEIYTDGTGLRMKPHYAQVLDS